MLAWRYGELIGIVEVFFSVSALNPGGDLGGERFRGLKGTPFATPACVTYHPFILKDNPG